MKASVLIQTLGCRPDAEVILANGQDEWEIDSAELVDDCWVIEAGDPA